MCHTNGLLDATCSSAGSLPWLPVVNNGTLEGTRTCSMATGEFLVATQEVAVEDNTSVMVEGRLEGSSGDPLAMLRNRDSEDST
jgi:hypothetical protein